VVPTPQGGAPAERAPESAARRGAAVSADAPLADEPPSTEQPPAAALEEPAAADEPTLPSAAALTAEGIALPDLRLELHAYSPRPAERFVFITGSKYLEGATLAEGPRLLTIRPNGAVLVYLGHRFLLAPQ
jgi:general secretion pathway protein B